MGGHQRDARVYVLGPHLANAQEHSYLQARFIQAVF
jgi:hypothetical protein